MMRPSNPDITPRRSLADESRGGGQIFGMSLLRAAAIVVVVLCHCYEPLVGEVGKFASYTILFPFTCSFFMLSGALILPVSGSYTEYFKRRGLRVVVPYVAWTVIATIVCYAQGSYDAWWAVHELLFGAFRPLTTTGWFFMVIVSLYLFYPIISPWLATASRRQIEYFMVVWLMSGFAVWLTALIQLNPVYNPFYMFVNYLGYAIAGFYLARFPIGVAVAEEPGGSRLGRLVDRMRGWMVYGGAVVLGLAVPIVMTFNGTLRDPSYYFKSDFTINTLLLACALFALLTRVKGAPRGVAYVVKVLSRDSFGIYLVHFPIRWFVLGHYFPEINESWWSFPVLFFGSLLLCEAIRLIPGARKLLL